MIGVVIPKTKGANMIQISAFSIAQRFIGIKEAAGVSSNPQILAMLRLDENWPAGDETAWCSAFVNYVAWLLRLPRSKSLAARSWLQVGIPIQLEQAAADSDVVIMQRGDGPGPEVVNAPGHVGFFAGYDAARGFVQLLGGNQGNAVSITSFPVEHILGIRRIS
jgi:uncharacterized protein (TIGR02594 family)